MKEADALSDKKRTGRPKTDESVIQSKNFSPSPKQCLKENKAVS